MKKKILVFTPIFLSVVLITALITPIINMSEDISEKVFRMHILANSDSDNDQELKLKVRDEVLKLTGDIFDNCSTVEDAVNSAKNNLDKIKIIVDKTIQNNGYSYSSNVYIIKEFFSTREYDSFTLPAGIYDSLKIEIGQGKGHNWWCVMFPSVCVSGCTSDFDETLSEEERNMIESGKYVVRFKIVEIYERIKNRC
ncbi:MAG: stage II sporulation protein R [Ruminococcaceae bacterium]|nr:stage II sporulation protein R [Oscillospiraceae bacterium]